MSEPRSSLDFYSGPEHQPFILGDGPVGVLLIHGFPGTPAEMRPLGEQLAGGGYHTRGILLPGFGPDIADLAQTNRHDWLDAAASAWTALRGEYQHTVLVGFSMGGAIAIHLAATTPPDALVLLAPFWRMGGWQFRFLPLLKHFIRSVAPFEKADFDDPEVRVQLADIIPGIDVSDPAVQRYLREDVRLPLGIVDEVRQLGQSAGKIAEQVASPTLVLQGTEDLAVPPEITRRLIERMAIPVTYQELPGDHGFAKEGSDSLPVLSAQVLAFLESLRHEHLAGH